VLFVALIVTVLMSLAAIAMIRSVDTANLAIGNLAFRQSAILPANYAIEMATAALFNDANIGGNAPIADTTANMAAQNYYAAYLNADDQYGIPQPLQTKTTATALTQQFTDGASNKITYVIERMCNSAAPNIPADHSATASWCDMMPPKVSFGQTVNDPRLNPYPPVAFFRVTVRVDGPQRTTSFIQAVLR